MKTMEVSSIVTIPNGNKIIGVTILNGVTSIGKRVFKNCSNLIIEIKPADLNHYRGLMYNSVEVIGFVALKYAEKSLKIYDMKGSYVERFAKKKGISFINNESVTFK